MKTPPAVLWFLAAIILFAVKSLLLASNLSAYTEQRTAASSLAMLAIICTAGGVAQLCTTWWTHHSRLTAIALSILTITAATITTLCILYPPIF